MNWLNASRGALKDAIENPVTGELKFSANEDFKRDKEKEFTASKDESLNSFTKFIAGKTSETIFGMVKEGYKENGEYSYTDTASTYNGTRRLKGQVNIKGIPVDVDYGDQKLDVITKIDPKTIGFEYSLTGEGKTFTDNKFKEVVRLYSEKMSEKMADIKKKSEENDKERDSKGFLFRVLAGTTMSGGGSKAFTQVVQNEIQGDVRNAAASAIASATGLPAGLISGLLGGQNLNQAMQSYAQTELNTRIAQAVGLPAGAMLMMNAQRQSGGRSGFSAFTRAAFSPFTYVGANLAIADLTIGNLYNRLTGRGKSRSYLDSAKK